jgi:hypothetical protein
MRLDKRGKVKSFVVRGFPFSSVSGKADKFAMAASDPLPPDCHERAASRARTALRWGVLTFLAGQAVLSYIVSCIHPEIRDPEFGYRLLRLRQLTASVPERPLCLILGSSRTLCGICPPALPPWPTEAGPEPCVFNFSQFCAGPVRELQTLRRLLADGQRPQWLLLEIWPPYWPQQGYWSDEKHIMQQDLRPVDLGLVWRYFRHRWDALSKLAADTLAPLTALRGNILACCAASLLAPDQHWRRLRMNAWRDAEPSGWRPWQERGPVEQFRARTAEYRTQMASITFQTKPCLDDFFVSDTTDRALREILEECRRRHIQAALILMPEHSQMRSWYTPTVHEQINAYLDRLKREYQVPVFDTRTWLADEAFYDLAHMAPPAAAPFTLRLGREMLLPWFRTSVCRGRVSGDFSHLSSQSSFLPLAQVDRRLARSRRVPAGAANQGQEGSATSVAKGGSRTAVLHIRRPDGTPAAGGGDKPRRPPDLV